MSKLCSSLVALLCVFAAVSGSHAFVSQQHGATRRIATTTELNFGIPSFQPKNEDNEGSSNGNNKPEKKMDLKGMAQLITAGMGAPFLGDFEGVDEESGKFMFSLEANNLVDKDGNSKQTSMPYFESGWVDPDDLAKEQKKKEEGFKFPWQK